MKTYYLIRLDDACPYMDKRKWEQIEHILIKYNICPLVGIIPNNEDHLTKIDSENPDFWRQALLWQDRGWTIALHGFNHCYITTKGGINPVHNRSEFAGVLYKDQREKISSGYQCLKSKGLRPTYFFAPSHTFDNNTIRVLKEETPIRLISDTMGRYPYKYDKEMIIVPCQMGKFRKINIGGYWTFCFHPNIMDDIAIYEFELFISQNHEKFISFSQLPLNNVKRRSIIDTLMNMIYLLIRKFR